MNAVVKINTSNPSNAVKYVFATTIYALISILIYYAIFPTKRLLREINVGDSENKLIEIISDKKYAQLINIYNYKHSKEKYYVKGWEYEEREINNKVYIYFVGAEMVYIYIDKNGNIEYIFIGGS
ncbi:MAG: hypothetical protein OEZ32_12680 [Nitrospinota bacterium]|nr:hypothetical protein [Nitrospinota bacterium]